jgi:exosortase B
MNTMTGPGALNPARSLQSLLPLAMLAVGMAVMFGPVFYKLAHTVWNTDEQGHGPIIIGVVVWLLWLRRDALHAAAVAGKPAGISGWLVLLLGLLTYVVGRIQNIVTFEMGAAIPLLTGMLAVTFGWRVVKVAAFPIFFILFAVPLPGAVVDALTQPLKQAVSWAAEGILYAMGYPVSRTGVILRVGQYQLLVADACAGLNSMFTLEALGLLYMNIVGHTSRLRNVLLAILIIPMAFIANIIRVMILVLVTYHFGDEAGQGVVHGAAGMVLFGVALVLMFIIDGVLGFFFRNKEVKPA